MSVLFSLLDDISVNFCGNHSVSDKHGILITSETTRHLVEFRVVEEVRSVSMNQGAEGQAILPATSAGEQKEPTCQVRQETCELQNMLESRFCIVLYCQAYPSDNLLIHKLSLKPSSMSHQ